jgi:hypothetical protein
MKVAGIDVHKKVLMVVVVDASMPEEKPARRRFVTHVRAMLLAEDGTGLFRIDSIVVRPLDRLC